MDVVNPGRSAVAASNDRAQDGGVDLTYTADEVDGELRLRLVGELDIDNADELRQLVRSAVDTPRVTGIQVDLLAVTFLDSSAISALLAGARAANEAGLRYRISRPRGFVRKVLDVTGVLPALVTPD
jgi:anti-anti-sigma factor